MNKKILKLAIPNILSNISIPLLGLVDTALMGHLANIDYLGAIALGAMIFNVIYWSLGFLRMGTVGFTAQAFGAGNQNLQNLILKRGLVLSTLLSFIIILFHPWIINLSINLTDSGVGVKYFAAEYVAIRIWAAPASLALMVFYGWFLGMQNALYPLIIAVLGNVFNIIFSYVLVYHFQLNSAGAAIGSVVAQYLSLGIAVFLFFKKYRYLNCKIKLVKILQISEMKEFFKVNSDIFIRTLGIIFVISFFTIQSANISDNILAINSILFQFFLFFSFMLDGFANAAEAMTGEYIGSKALKLLKLAVRKNLIFGLAFSGLFSLFYGLFGIDFVRLLTDNQEVIESVKPLIVFLVVMPFVSFMAFVFDGIFIGATASASLRNGMIISVVFVFVPIYYFTSIPDLNRIWIAFLGFMAARGFTLAFMLKKSVYGKVIGSVD